MNIDEKIETAVRKAMADANKPAAKPNKDGPIGPEQIIKEGLMKELYDDMLDFHRKSSNSKPTKQIRDDYIARQQSRLTSLRKCESLTASEKIMFTMAESALGKLKNIPVKA
jgi:hypothetical protein